MLQASKTPESTQAEASSLDADAEDLRRQSRTPRPYAHDGIDVRQDADVVPSTATGTTPVLDHERDDDDRQPRQPEERVWQRETSITSSESGTEADDERPVAGFVKALPPAFVRLRKGLKTGELNEDALLTPSQLDDEGRRLYEGYFPSEPVAKQRDEVEERAEQEKLQKRRFAEFVRRSSEVALMAVILIAVLCGRDVLVMAWVWRRELLSHVAIMAGLILSYPVKLSIVDQQSRHIRLWQRFRVPASFDPATVLYPPLLPVLVALSVTSKQNPVVLPNIILGLSSLPQRLFPRSSRLGGINAMHWLISIIPLIVSENTTWPSKLSPAKPYALKNGLPYGLSPETLVSLYPLHHALLVPLQYLTTTSLLISELHLLSAALINLLLLATSPQTTILKACLWIGGTAILVSCGPVLEWNIALARVPKWKLRRPGHSAEERKSLVDAVSDLINLQRATAAFKSTAVVDSDADDDKPKRSIKQPLNGMPTLNVAGLVSPSLMGPQEQHSAVDPKRMPDGLAEEEHQPPLRPRRNTVSARELSRPQDYIRPSTRKPSPRKGGKKFSGLWCLQLTPDQAQHRKWMYAGYTYAAIIMIILGLVREYISRKALHHMEAVGWAIGYLFGQIPPAREVVESLSLDRWIPLPISASDWRTITFSIPLDIPEICSILGGANVRLLLIAYWAAVLLVGLLVVFSLTAYVEVDTRRKVFHGVMVAMLLPATFVDPCYCALALSLALAIFLVLEVIRAGQVPPLGKAIGRFVAPYVDGRDLRGPVVVSHIFLLIGSAVPLLFSLASIDRAGSPPWIGWELVECRRETAMVAGVICVGMGDAAASLIGRRYGRRKWIWVGGKSLEGSAAFAAAVTVGLMATKAWLVLGGWTDNGQTITTNAGYVTMGLGWCFALIKAVFCACGASFMEAVLTGANDNVVVPVALWLLVKGVRL